MTNEKDILRWTQVLRSGKYKQTTGFLQDYSGYCCLGVACELFIPKGKIEVGVNGFIRGGLPYAQTNSPKWLKDIANDFQIHTGRYLYQLNDVGFVDAEDKLVPTPLTFDEIADCLEAVYVHKVLE